MQSCVFTVPKTKSPSRANVVAKIQEKLNRMYLDVSDPSALMFSVQCLCKKCVNPKDKEFIIRELEKLTTVFYNDYPDYDSNGNKIEHHVDSKIHDDAEYIVFVPSFDEVA